MTITIATTTATSSASGARKSRDARTIRTLREAVVVFGGYGSPRLLAVQLVALLAIRLSLGHFTVWDAIIVAAVALYWPVQEWVLHAFVLHMRPRHVLGRRVDPEAARLHRVHHRHPWQVEHVFLPSSLVVLLVPVNVVGWWLALASGPLAVTGMTAMGAAALLYEWIHYMTHIGYSPKSRAMQAIRRAHRLHHFKHEGYWYGFTAPIVDTIMRTAPDPHDIETSPTCRTLGVDEE